MRGPENFFRPTQAPSWFFLQSMKFSKTFSAKKRLSELEKKVSAIFYFGPRLIFELNRENGRKTSNTGSKSYVWHFFRRIYAIALEKERLSVEAVWVMPSVTGCHILSTPIRKAKPNISDGGTSPYTFATSFNGEKPEEKTMESTKKLLKIFHVQSHFVNAMTKIKKIRFREEKLKAVELTKFFEHFRLI